MGSRSSSDAGRPTTSGPDRGPRLDAYLSRAGLLSRKAARLQIGRGQVRVDGEVCRDSARRISAREVVTLGDGRVESPVQSADYLMNKPVGYACSHDEREAPRVLDLLEPELLRRPLKLVGRLDRATSGLLILTTDGALVHALTHPSRHCEKRYRIEYSGELAADSVARCAEGLMLQGDTRPTRPSTLTLDAPGQATLRLREGRTHQVRRMIRALGGRVTALHRDRVGGLDLPADLAPGALRPLLEEERALLLTESSL